MASGVTESSVMASYERRSICGLLFTDRLAKIPKGTSKESGILEITGHGLYQTSVTNFTSGADGPFLVLQRRYRDRGIEDRVDFAVQQSQHWTSTSIRSLFSKKMYGRLGRI